jgi:hypothetical protein
MVSDADVARNGAANTFLFGEKYMDPQHYIDAQDAGDVAQLYSGFSADWERWGGTQSSSAGANSVMLTSGIYVNPTPPMRDLGGASNPTVFGSAHADGLNMFMCDGSGHWTSYNIDGATFAVMCSRINANPVDTTKLKW